jgi:GntR family transcriptional regulator
MPNHSTHVPLYADVEDTLAFEIVGHALPPGSQIPPENKLIERFGVSRTTIRKAIENLVSRGLLRIERGRGTFVAEPKITQELRELTGFVEDMHALGRVPTARLLDKQAMLADKAVARRLDLAPGSLVMRFHRVRLADGRPVSFDETYLPHELGEKVAGHDLDQEPIFALLEQRYGVALADADYQLEATTAGPLAAAALGVEVGAPVFLIERTSYTADGRPIDFERLYYRGDQIRFVTRLTRRAPLLAGRG